MNSTTITRIHPRKSSTPVRSLPKKSSIPPDTNLSDNGHSPNAALKTSVFAANSTKRKREESKKITEEIPTKKAARNSPPLVANVNPLTSIQQLKSPVQDEVLSNPFTHNTDTTYTTGEIERITKIFCPNQKIKEFITHYRNKEQLTQYYTSEGILLPNITKIFANKETYYGTFDDNKMSGIGKYTFLNGDTYIGRFESDSALGYMRDGDKYTLNLNEKPIKNARYIFKDEKKISGKLDRIAEKSLPELFRIMKKS